jgi:hypothetical protein
MIFNRSTTKPGSSWFLIAMDWWLRWESTCSSSIINSNELKNKKIPSNKTDHRLIKNCTLFVFFFIVNSLFLLELNQVILIIHY